jgi:hypothetical protein
MTRAASPHMVQVQGRDGRLGRNRPRLSDINLHDVGTLPTCVHLVARMCSFVFIVLDASR